jgi:hypothetical protein
MLRPCVALSLARHPAIDPPARAFSTDPRRLACAILVALATITGQPSGTRASVESRPGIPDSFLNRQHFQAAAAREAAAAGPNRIRAIGGDRVQGVAPGVSPAVAGPKE